MREANFWNLEAIFSILHLRYFFKKSILIKGKMAGILSAYNNISEVSLNVRHISRR